MKPLWCTPQELEENVKRMCREFYTYRSMLRRLPLPKSQASIANWVVNMSERRVVRAKFQNNDFDGL